MPAEQIITVKYWPEDYLINPTAEPLLYSFVVVASPYYDITAIFQDGLWINTPLAGPETRVDVIPPHRIIKVWYIQSDGGEADDVRGTGEPPSSVQQMRFA